jgi:hypothetical protein
MVDSKRKHYIYKFAVPAIDKEHAIRCAVDISYALNDATDHRLKLSVADAKELPKTVDIA